MRQPLATKTQFFFRPPLHWFRVIVIIILALGIFFRFANIEQKIYWHDEVYTSIRTTGYTSEEIGKIIFNNRIFTPQDLQIFQKLKPGSTALDTIKSLALEDPQHPPFYFLLARLWQLIWGYNLTSARTLPIIISLLSLFLIYRLALELFNEKFSAILAASLLALSPFDIIFAQIARQYSLLTLSVILSYLCLCRSFKKSTFFNWTFYTLSCALGLYTHLFFILTLIAQGIFGLMTTFQNQQHRQKLFAFLISFIASIILYLPWLIILVHNRTKAFSSTSWAVSKLDIIYFLKLWVLSFTSLFTDLFFGLDNWLTYLYRFLFFGLIIFAIYTVYKKADRFTFLLILTSILIPFFLLIIPDLILETRRSTITRYLISCFPGVQLAVAYLLADKLSQKQKLWQIIFALVLTNSIISNSINTVSETSWAIVPSHLNGSIARKINAVSSPLIISDEGYDWTNLGDLISLSYLLKNDVKLFLASDLPDINQLKTITQESQSELFVYRPSKKLKLVFEKINKPLKYSYESGNLWQFKQ